MQGEVVRLASHDWLTSGTGGAKGEVLHPHFVALHPRLPGPTYHVNGVGNIALK